MGRTTLTATPTREAIRRAWSHRLSALQSYPIALSACRPWVKVRLDRDEDEDGNGGLAVPHTRGTRVHPPIAGQWGTVARASRKNVRHQRRTGTKAHTHCCCSTALKSSSSVEEGREYWLCTGVLARAPRPAPRGAGEACQSRITSHHVTPRHLGVQGSYAKKKTGGEQQAGDQRLWERGKTGLGDKDGYGVGKSQRGIRQDTGWREHEKGKREGEDEQLESA